MPETIIRCPICHRSPSYDGGDDWEYLEDVSTSRRWPTVHADGTLLFDGDSKVLWDCSTNERLICPEFHEVYIPPGSIDFV